jgi:hypothetical protein
MTRPNKRKSQKQDATEGISDAVSKCLHIDGKEVVRSSVPQLLSSECGLHIGTGKNLEPSSFWSGLIDDVRVYNQALEPDEIAD